MRKKCQEKKLKGYDIVCDIRFHGAQTNEIVIMLLCPLGTKKYPWHVWELEKKVQEKLYKELLKWEEKNEK